MIHFIEVCGPAGLVLVILSVAILVLALLRARRLYPGRALPDPGLEHGINAILFWGAIGALIGVLGQFTGIYNALQAIARAAEISPKIVMTGLAESFTSTLFGLIVLTISALIWFSLRNRYRRLTAGHSFPETRVE